MIQGLDHVVVAVEDLDAASADYERLLGRRPSWRGGHPQLGTANTLFRLANTYLELLAPAGPGPFADQLRERHAREGEGLLALAFGVDDADACAKELRERGLRAGDPVPGQGRDRQSDRMREWRNVMLPAEQTRGLFVFCIEHRSPEDALPPAEPTGSEPAAVSALDHVVVSTADADGARGLFGDVLGLRLALDRSFERFGSRMLFFRTGGVTVEVVARLDEEPDPEQADRLWGLAYQVPDVDAARRRLSAAGCDVSDSREGRKPGTRVCTVREATHGVPTLLIQPVA